MSVEHMPDARSVLPFTAWARAAAASASRRATRIRHDPQAQTVSPPMSNARFPEDCASQFRAVANRAGPEKSRRRPGLATKTARAPAAW